MNESLRAQTARAIASAPDGDHLVSDEERAADALIEAGLVSAPLPATPERLREIAILLGVGARPTEDYDNAAAELRRWARELEAGG